MKATGIVRRVDDLGRVVIPKEVRRTFKIREGDPLEIFVSENGIVFRPYHRNCTYCGSSIDENSESELCKECSDYLKDYYKKQKEKMEER